MFVLNALKNQVNNDTIVSLYWVDDNINLKWIYILQHQPKLFKNTY